jgi:flagellar biogenesis protein FliO
MSSSRSRVAAGLLAAALLLMHAAAFCADGSAIPFKRDSEATADLSGRAVAALVACLAVGGVAIYLLRKKLMPGAPRPSARRIRLIEVQRVGLKSSVVLLRWDDEELLLAQAENQVQVLARKPAREGDHQPSQSRQVS